MATFQNQATLSYNGVQTESNVVSGEVLSILSITKTAVEKYYARGTDVTYVVSLVNASAVALTDLTLTDDLGAYAFGSLTLRPLTYVNGSALYYVNGSLQATPAVSVASGDLVISGISVPAGGNATLIYGTQANEFAPLDTGATVTNTATVTGDGVISASDWESIDVSGSASLSIIKSVCPATVYDNDRITYTFVIYNGGNTATTAEGNAVVTDLFDPILTDIVVTLDGIALAEGTGYTYDETTGEFATADGVITVPAATYTQDETTGELTIEPGSVTLTVTGTI